MERAEAAIDRLYALPLAEFTAARDALAKAARQDGDRDLASRIKALAKPAVPAWTLNQLARRDPKRFARWIGTVDELRAAQVGLLSGQSDAGATREAQRAEREAMVQLREAAAEVLGADKPAANIALLERTVRTFRGAAVDDEARAQLTEGRLTVEHDEPGFDALVAGYSSVTGSVAPVHAAPKPSTKVSPSIVIAKRPAADERAAVERKRREAALRERLRAAREERSAARAESTRAAKAAERAEQAADEAVTRAAKARADANEAERALRQAEEKVAALEREVS